MFVKYKYYKKLIQNLQYNRKIKQKKSGKKRRCQILDFKNNLLKKYGHKLQ